MRRTDGTAVAVPVWMTRPEAAYTRIVSAARLSVRAMFELQRVTTIGLSARAHNVHEENQDAPTTGKTPAKTLRGTAARSPARFPPDVQDQVRQALVQWMQALAKTIQKKEHDNEQDHR